MFRGVLEAGRETLIFAARGSSRRDMRCEGKSGGVLKPDGVGEGSVPLLVLDE